MRITVARTPLSAWFALLALALFVPVSAHAEPYLAVRSGLKCAACHVNPSGGGKRTEFGAAYAQTALAREQLDPATGQAATAGAAPTIWTGRLNDQFAIGADLRATLQSVKVPGSKETLAFSPTRAQLYLEVKPLGERLSFYLDERVAPGAATSREAYACSGSASGAAMSRRGESSFRSDCESKTTPRSSARSRE